tara:strand:+ start:1117 stop:1320 length:204 start_codon:yes stop_codon:yes gene_type:complete
MEDNNTILIWIDQQEKMYEVNYNDWINNRDSFDKLEGGYSEHPKGTHKSWTYTGKNQINELLKLLNQ